MQRARPESPCIRGGKTTGRGRPGSTAVSGSHASNGVTHFCLRQATTTSRTLEGAVVDQTLNQLDYQSD